eukprot:COSAG02_NODE_45068_length_360_cov_1.172414_1_plen_47_part_10
MLETTTAMPHRMMVHATAEWATAVKIARYVMYVPRLRAQTVAPALAE